MFVCVSVLSRPIVGSSPPGLYPASGAGTNLKVGGTMSGAKRQKFFLPCPPPTFFKVPPKWRGTVHSSGVHAFTVLCLKLVYSISWSRCNILTRLLCDNKLVITDIERLMNVSTYFSDNGNNSSWIDHFMCIVFCAFVIFPVFLLSFIWYGPVLSEIKLEWMNRNLGFEQWLVYFNTQRRSQNNNSEWHGFFYVLTTQSSKKLA